MDEFQTKLEIAKKKIYVSEYMLTHTYNLLKDPKILLSILENIHLAFDNALNAILSYEREFKRIASIPEAFEIKLDMYENKVEKNYKLNPSFSKSMYEINELIEAHNKAPMEFQRHESYIIADDYHNLKKINGKELQEYVKTCKEFVIQIDQITKFHQE